MSQKRQTKWIPRKIEANDGEATRTPNGGAPQPRNAADYHVGEQADRLVRIVDRYLPRIADENREYGMRYPNKMSEMLKKARPDTSSGATQTSH